MAQGQGRSTIAAIVIAAVAGVALATTAFAQCTTLGNCACDAGEVCVWRDSNYKFDDCFHDFLAPNDDGDYTDGSPSWNCQTGGRCNVSTLNDKISSYQNRSSHWVIFGQNKSDQSGQHFCAAPGANSPNLSNFEGIGGIGWNPNDSFTSHYTRPTEPGENPNHPLCNYRDRD